MYNLTEAAIEAFKLRRASIQIPVDLLSGDDIPALTEKDLKSATLERIGVSGKTIEIGAARVYELKLRLKNTYGEFDGISFDGARIFPRIIAGQYTCPLGYFTIDGHEKGTGYIELTALDRMVLFDKVATYEQVAFPITVKNLVFAACYACGVDSSRLDIDGLPNADYSVQNAPEDDTTWRQIIMWCGELMGVNSYMDAEGYFCMAWCNQTQLRITASDRYTHKLFENDVTVAGVEVIDYENEVTYLAGSDSGYKFTIDGNELLTHDHESVASALGAKLVGFSYRPFTATTLSMPNIFPYDMMTYVEPNGETHSALITHCKFTLNGNTELESTGESETTSGYAYANMLTKQEQKILAALKKEDEKTRQEMTTREQALIRMNEVIANAMGLYFIPVTSSVDGSTKYYFTNRPTLEESTLIYVFNSGGFAWSNKWEGDKTVWKYGITSEGNAFLNYLSLNKLDANYIEVESIVGKINESTGDSELSITAEHIKVDGQTLTTHLSQTVEGLKEEVSDDISDALNDYTDTTLKTELTQYVTSSEMSMAMTQYVENELEGYAKTSELDIYLTSEKLAIELTDYATKTAGTATTFSYSLTANGFTITCNNSTVLKADATGLEVAGKITANEGQIAGLQITAESIVTSGNVTGTIRRLFNSTDTFHINVEEDENGNAVATDVLITDLHCDNINAKNSSNGIDLCYTPSAATITATVSIGNWNCYETSHLGWNCNGNLSISLSGTLGSQKELTIYLWYSQRYARIVNITIPAGASGLYTAGFDFYITAETDALTPVFAETSTNTITFSSANQDAAAIKIKGQVVPDENATQDFGSTTRKWGNGYFNGLKVGENDVAAPYIYEDRTISVYKQASSVLLNNTSGQTLVGNARMRVIKLGKIGIVTITYEGALELDAWYRLSPGLYPIYTAQATPRSALNADLNGNNCAGALCVYYDSWPRVFVGCDEFAAANGFDLLIVGELDE